MRVMSMMGFSKKYGIPWAIPDWPYAKYFENEIPQKNDVVCIHQLKEPCFHYTGFYYDKIDWSKNIDLRGFFQSPNYWTEKLRFKKEYLLSLVEKYDLSNNPVAVGVRRGSDWVDNKVYYQLPLEYYTGALRKYFPDRPVFFFSNDLEWCRNRFGFVKEATYIHASDIEQLAVMTLCTGHVISQSTFSYMGAYLGESEKVIRPIKNFDGDFAKKNSDRDFFPNDDRWIIYDYENQNE